MIDALPPPPNPADVFSRFGGAAITRTAEDIVNPFERFEGFSLPSEGENEIIFHEKLTALFQPSRYKVLEGGRGSMKSWGVARALIIIALQDKKLILCAREYQTSIEDSVYKLLKDQIERMGLSPWFSITKKSIKATNGSEFRFVGLGDLSQRQNRSKIKSFEGVDICWIEEAEGITDTTWEILIPTIRKAGSEIWIVYNPNLATDATYQRFHVNPPKNCVRIVLNWRENVWLSEELRMEKDHLFAVDPEAAAHVWDGELRQHAEATIFRHKFLVESFEPPENVRYYHGADWGFSQDPTTLIRCWITGGGQDAELWIDQEAWGIGIDFASYDPSKPILCQDIANPRSRPGLFEKIPTAKNWPIKADCSRPETISYVRSVGGYNISAAEKWDGSVEDGITHLRGFKLIHVHTRCNHTADEFKLYSYKVDKITGEILPIIIDKHNHCIDAIRYALDGFIQRRGAANIWARLGRAQ
jgi:phage terminase large subunit